MKCGLIEKTESQFVDTINKEAYVWCEKDWKHDDYEHVHHRAQLPLWKKGISIFILIRKFIWFHSIMSSGFLPE
jgi:hypothetical protein